MIHRALVSLVTVIALLSLAPAIGAAPPAETSDPLRTADGRPDLQGTYTFRTLTRLERPAALEGREALDPETAVAFEASENKRLNRDLFDPIKGAPSAGYAPRARRAAGARHGFVRADLEPRVFGEPLYPHAGGDGSMEGHRLLASRQPRR